MGIDSLVLSALVGVSCGSLGEREYRDACTASIEATSKSVGIYDRLKTWEDKQKEAAKKEFKKVVTQKYRDYVTTVMLTAAASAGREVSIRLWKDKYGGSYLLRTDFESTIFLIGWNF